VPIEQRLRQLAILRVKAGLPARAGLAGAALERWRALVERLGALPTRVGGGIAALAWPGDPGFLASLSLTEAGARPEVCANVVAWHGASGTPDADTSRLTDALAAAESSRPLPVGTAELARALQTLHIHARSVLRDAHAAAWLRAEPAPGARLLARRLGIAGRDAARRRSARDIDVIDRALRFLSRGHTAGEQRLILELASLPDAELRVRIARLPPVRQAGPLSIRLDGIILFRSESAPLR